MTNSVINYVTLPKDAVLFRAANTLEIKPKSIMCGDTGKTGVYFSFNHPYLAETMCLEHNCDMIIGQYKLTDDLTVSYGKYAFTRNYTGKYAHFNWTVDPSDNLSHYDEDICPLVNNLIEPDEPYAEVFLTGNDLNNIEFVRSYQMTVDNCKNKWCK